MKSAELASALLEQAGIACLSGHTFGAHGEGYLRFSYANSLDNLRTALHSLGEYLSVRAR
jgi:aspartate/methionine/tyrosine aminotransferase